MNAIGWAILLSFCLAGLGSWGLSRWAQPWSSRPWQWGLGGVLGVWGIALGLYAWNTDLESLRHSLQAQSMRGRVQKALHEPQFSIPQLRQRLQAIVQAHPQDAKGWYLLGRLYLVEQRSEEALKAFQAGVKVAPQDIPLRWNFLLTAWQRDGEQFTPETSSLFQSLWKEAPDLRRDLEDLKAWNDTRQGDFEAAIHHWRQRLLQLPADHPQTSALETLMLRLSQAQETAVRLQVCLPQAWAKHHQGQTVFWIVKPDSPAPPKPFLVHAEQVRAGCFPVLLSSWDQLDPTQPWALFSRVQLRAVLSKTPTLEPRTHAAVWEQRLQWPLKTSLHVQF